MIRNLLDPMHMAAALIYAGIGLAVLFAAFVIVDKVTPYDLWQEIVQKQNRALASLVGAISIGISIIVAASILG